MSGRVLVARLDSDGDVLISGPAVRAVRAGADHVTLLVGPRGRNAAALLPGVDDIIVWTCPWIDPEPEPVDPGSVAGLVRLLAARRVDEAVILTSFHQSPLPLALVLRMAGVGRITAASEDYPGSLLDVRHRLPEVGSHEVERALSTAAAAGYPLPAGDDGRPRVRGPLPDTRGLTGPRPYVVIHPGASVPARAWNADGFAAVTAALARSGRRVVVTGGPAESGLTAAVAGDHGVDLAGATDLPTLAGVLEQAAVVVVGNTGPAHLAAAVGTPVVSLFAPTVPAQRWAPYTPDRILVADLDIACGGCRARHCPVPGHPCMSAVTVGAVLAAVDAFHPAPTPATRPAPSARPVGTAGGTSILEATA